MKIKLFGKEITFYQLVLHVIVIVLAFEVVFLINEIKSIKNAKTDYLQKVLQQGERVSPVDIESLNGVKRQFPDTTRRRTSVLFLFQTKCPFCKDNIPKWNLLTERLKTDSIDIVAVSTHKKDWVIDYVKQNDLRSAAYVPRDSAFLKVFKPHAVPQTIVISKDLRVMRIYLGPLTDAVVDSLSTTLKRR